MLKYPVNGALVHITSDGERTWCGRACDGWWTEDAPTDWAGHKSDCPRCGTPADFRVQRSDRDQANSERALTEAAIAELRNARRVAALAALDALADEWVALVSERCPDGVFAVERWRGATTINGTVTRDGVDLDIIVKVKI